MAALSLRLMTSPVRRAPGHDFFFAELADCSRNVNRLDILNIYKDFSNRRQAAGGIIFFKFLTGPVSRHGCQVTNLLLWPPPVSSPDRAKGAVVI